MRQQQPHLATFFKYFSSVRSPPLSPATLAVARVHFGVSFDHCEFGIERRLNILHPLCFSYCNRANINLFIMRGSRHLPIHSQLPWAKKNSPKNHYKHTYMAPIMTSDVKNASYYSFSPCVSFRISVWLCTFLFRRLQSTYTNRFFNEPATVIFGDHFQSKCSIFIILLKQLLEIKCAHSKRPRVVPLSLSLVYGA